MGRAAIRGIALLFAVILLLLWLASRG